MASLTAVNQGATSASRRGEQDAAGATGGLTDSTAKRRRRNAAPVPTHVLEIVREFPRQAAQMVTLAGWANNAAGLVSLEFVELNC